ncbi:MAG: hypothetical protein Kow0074_05230 [Candidatus Zixiibacteriota bacterium]
MRWVSGHLPLPRQVHDTAGMTILEMLLAVLIGSLVLYASLETFVTMNHQTIWQDQVTEAQQSGRAVQRALSEHIRMAGFGIPRLLPPVTGTDSEMDTIIITHQDPDACEAFLSESMANASDPIVVDGSDISCFKSGMWVYIHDPAVDSGEFFQVSNTYTGPPTIETSGGLQRPYAMGSGVYHIEQVMYYIDNNDPDHPIMMEKRYGRSPMPFADNIESFDVAFVMQNGDTVQTPFDPYMVTNVLVNMVARSSRVDDEIAEDYRRRDLSFNVSVRNLEF